MAGSFGLDALFQVDWYELTTLRGNPSICIEGATGLLEQFDQGLTH